MVDLLTAIANLEAKQERLAQTDEFFRAHYNEYLAVARVTARQVLQLNPPDDVSADVWEMKIDNAVDRIASDLVIEVRAGLLTGIDLTLALGGDEQLEFIDPERIRIEEILDWIEAGERGEDFGKRLDERDTGAGTDKKDIAYEVLYALKRGHMSGESINLYLFNKAAENVNELLDAILKAWMNVLAAKTRVDWREWVSDAVSRGVNEPF